MKAQFLLMLITLNGLLLCANSASATAVAPRTADRQIADLSKTIAKLIDFDDRSLVELAINRALLAQNKDTNKTNPVDTNGEPVRRTGAIESNHTDREPVVRGRVANPKPIINGRIANPNPKPIINGKIANPNPKPSEPPLINGLIFNPNRQ